MSIVQRTPRTDDAFPSHPGEPYTYPQARTPERSITEEGVRQYVGPKWKITVSNATSTGTVTVNIDDPANTVDPANRVKFDQDGTLNILPTTAPSGTTVDGDYVFVFNKYPRRPTLIRPVIYLLDGTVIRPGTETFDWGTQAEVDNLAYAPKNPTTCTVSAQCNTETDTGAGNIEWSVNGGSTWTTETVNSDWTASWDVALTTSIQTVTVRAYNGTTWGPTVSIVIPTSGDGASADITAMVDRTWVSAVDYTANTVTVSWEYEGNLADGCFQLLVIDTSGTAPDLSITPSSVAITTTTSAVFNTPEDIQTATGPKVTYSFLVKVCDALTNSLRAASCGWQSVTYSHA